MSRTDVHRPWPVQVADPHNRHRFYRYPAWPSWGVELAPVKNFACGCKMCTGQVWRKQGRRQDRHYIRRALRAAAGQWAAGQLDEDAPRPRRPKAW